MLRSEICRYILIKVKYERIVMYSLIIYQAITNTAYFRIVRVADGAVMVTLTGVLSKTTAFNTSNTALATDAIIGGFPVTIPANLEPGDYDLLIYDEAAAPVATDIPIIVRRIEWKGPNLVAGVPISIVSI